MGLTRRSAGACLQSPGPRSDKIWTRGAIKLQQTTPKQHPDWSTAEGNLFYSFWKYKQGWQGARSEGRGAEQEGEGADENCLPNWADDDLLPMAELQQHRQGMGWWQRLDRDWPLNWPETPMVQRGSISDLKNQFQHWLFSSRNFFLTNIFASCLFFSLEITMQWLWI